MAWPANGGSVSFDAAFSSAHPAGAAGEPTADDYFGRTFSGTLLDAGGKPAAPGTAVEAYIGDALCGRKIVAPVVMVFDQPGSYEVSVAGPTSSPGCSVNGPVTFKINGTAVLTDISREGHPLDLVVP